MFSRVKTDSSREKVLVQDPAPTGSAFRRHGSQGRSAPSGRLATSNQKTGILQRFLAFLSNLDSV